VNEDSIEPSMHTRHEINDVEIRHDVVVKFYKAI